MGNSDECTQCRDHKIIDNPNSCYGLNHNGKFCDVWHLIKEKYLHIKGMKGTASATLTSGHVTEQMYNKYCVYKKDPHVVNLKHHYYRIIGIIRFCIH